jgi:hypothetical protein
MTAINDGSIPLSKFQKVGPILRATSLTKG